MGRLSDLFAKESASAANACSHHLDDALTKKHGGSDDTQCLAEGLLTADEFISDCTNDLDTKHRTDHVEENCSLTENESARKIRFSNVCTGRITFERFLVQNYLRHYKWYNPQRDNPKAPSLEEGWDFFEHFTLPRHFTQIGNSRSISGCATANSDSPKSVSPINPFERVVTAMTKAPPGEKKYKTRLYNPMTTPLHSLSDWGIGVGMYFSTLASMIVVFALAGLLNVKNMLYYASKEYDRDRFEKERGGFPLMNPLKYSTVCMTREWAVCVDCDENKSYWNNIFVDSYYGTATNPVTGQTQTLINRTTCAGAEIEQGIWNIVTLLFLIVGISLFVSYQNQVEVRLDEGKTSASDYSILISNPPDDAVDPEEWREFFDGLLGELTGEKQQQVTLCTIALNNHRLLKNLVQRRKDLKLLKTLLSETCELSDMNDGAAVDAAVTLYMEQKREQDTQVNDGQPKSVFKQFAAFLFLPFSVFGKIVHFIRRISGHLPTEPHQLWGRIQSITQSIRLMQEFEVYKASAVYVTFETEQAQRAALKALNAGRFEVWTNKRVHLEGFALFRRNLILDIHEADEPDTCRWCDLDSTGTERIIRRICSLVVTLGMTLLSILTLPLIRVHVNTIFYSVILSTYNMIIPLVVQSMVSFEKHPDEGDKQQSLYINIALFRWINTVIVTDLTTPFLAKLGVETFDMMNSVNALLISEMVYSPILKFLDIGGIIQRHYLAPRAKTQESMHDNFHGGYYSMAERYTDFTKVLLLCIFYSPYYPIIFFFGVGILFVQFWTDKILLMRAWQTNPSIGPETSRFSRRYFTTVAIVIGAISAATVYANFPFTNLCNCPDGDDKCAVDVSQMYSNVTLLSGERVESVETSAVALKFCNQAKVGFPPVPEHQGFDNIWMTKSQRKLTTIYGWISFVLLVLFVVGLFGNRVTTFLLSLWKGIYEPSGFDQQKDFTDGIGVDSFAYVPQLKEPGFTFPMLACDISKINSDLIGWKPLLSYESCNLIFDVPFANDSPVDRPVFSIVRQWAPRWSNK